MRRLISEKRARAIMAGFAKTRVLVVGDLIMDHFMWGSVKRISPEAPVPVVDVTDESIMLGGSANVVNNIISLGGGCVLTGVCGRDDDGKRLFKELADKKVPVGGIVVDKTRPTTIKTRVIAHNQQVVRFDRESRAKISPRIMAKVLDFVNRSVRRVDAIIISDYAKGLITPELIEELVGLAARKGIPVAVDPKVEHFKDYKNVNLITPNNLEASEASGIDITDNASLKRAGGKLKRELSVEALLVTRGENGMSLFSGSTATHIPTVAKEVYDVSGAGDTVIGVMGLAIGSGATYKEAAVLANFAAGMVVGKVGTATVTLAELRRAVRDGLKKG